MLEYPTFLLFRLPGGAYLDATLDRYARLDVRTMVGTHGRIHSRDLRVLGRPFLTRRADPNRMIADKATLSRMTIF